MGLGCGPPTPTAGAAREGHSRPSLEQHERRGASARGTHRGDTLGSSVSGRGSQPPRIQWVRSRARPARWGHEKAGGLQSSGLADEGDRSAGVGGVYPYIKAGPATREGGGETGVGGEARRKRQAAPLISTRWLSPPGTSEISGEGRGVFSGSALTAAWTLGPAPFPIWN